MSKTYKLYCEICNWWRITEDYSDMFEIKTAPIQRNIPKYDPEQKKTIEKSPKDQATKLRCPNCGRAVIPKIIDEKEERKKYSW